MLLNYTYRIKPDQQKTQLLDEWLETLRVSYNYALRELKDWMASRKCPIDRCSLESEYIMSANYPFPSYHQQQNNLPKAKQEFPRLKSVPSQVLQTNIRRLHDAWDFFRQRGYGFPRFKKVGQVKSLLFPQFKTNPITGWQIQLPKLGKVEINLHRPVPDNHIAFKRKDYQFKLAHKLCAMADTIFVEDIDFRTMAKGFLGKHTIDAGFGQFRSILKFVGNKRGVFVGEVDHRGTSQTCPNCRITVKKELSDRIHYCPECHYEVDRDVAAAQEICNRGIETVMCLVQLGKNT